MYAYNYFPKEKTNEILIKYLIIKITNEINKINQTR